MALAAVGEDRNDSSESVMWNEEVVTQDRRRSVLFTSGGGIRADVVGVGVGVLLGTILVLLALAFCGVGIGYKLGKIDQGVTDVRGEVDVRLELSEKELAGLREAWSIETRNLKIANRTLELRMEALEVK